MKKTLTLFACLLVATFAGAQNGPYWATDVAPIFYANCTKCHNPSGIAPFSLLSYGDAMPELADISTAVSTNIMPPWPPDTSYTRFCKERILSQQDIQTITDWVANGAQPGNLSAAPTPPVYSSAAQITNPDLMVQMPLYTVNAATDLYRCFVMPSGLTSSEYITKIEVIPGNRPIVHHVLIYQDQSNTCVNLDNSDPGPGYTWFGDVGSNTASLVAGWVPGQGVYELPANMGIQIQANAKLIMQVHYPAGTFNQVDSTQVRFTFSSGTVRNVTLAPIINHYASITNGPLFIPADSVRTFYAQENVAINGTLISIAPHMHLIGRDMTNYAVTPIGDTIPLIRINDWNFHWQGFYNFRQPVHIPYGSTLYAHAMYDNTNNNAANPNNPPQDVSVGESTTDEMFIVYYAFLAYQPGDENIIVDSTLLGVPFDHAFNDLVHTPQLYDPYPVPAANGEDANVSYFLPDKTNLRIEILDAAGKLVEIPVKDELTSAGFGNSKVNTKGLAKGTYFVRLSAGGTVRSKTLIIE